MTDNIPPEIADEGSAPAPVRISPEVRATILRALTKAEREELRKIIAEARDVCHCGQYVDEHTVSDNHAALAMDTQESDRLTAASLEAMPRLLADLDAAEADARELRDILRRHNFAPCDTAACNCNGWHERATGSGFYARFQEIDEAVGEHDGQTLLDAVKQIVAERKAAVLWAEKAEKAMTCKGCGGTVGDHLAPDQGGCPGSFEIDGVQMVPLSGRNEALAQRDRAEAELDAERRMRVEAEAARDDARGELDDISSESGYAVSFDEEGNGDDRTLPEFVRDLAAERDALKEKLDDPRRVLIHETEVVATKEEIAKLKKELADLSEADEELHACRALVNATSENLSVDLERMVDDLAEANEKAARSEKDAHSWCELYTDTKAKLAALLSAIESIDPYPHSDDGTVCRSYFGQSCNCLAQPNRDALAAAIAAARGGAAQ